LRCKAKLGDADARVTAACFAALLSLAPHGSLGFVAGFLEHADESMRDAALIALGESRSPEALPALRAFAEAASVPRADGVHGDRADAHRRRLGVSLVRAAAGRRRCRADAQKRSLPTPTNHASRSVEAASAKR